MASGDSHPRRLAGVKDPLRRALTSKICKLETGSLGSSADSTRPRLVTAPVGGRLTALAGAEPWLQVLEATEALGLPARLKDG